ncbi:MAG: glycosyltransferase family 4 protein [Cyclobacteriaceae bacterium]
MPRPWYFVLPEEKEQPSGGNIYNDRIIKALAQWGQVVNIISVDEYREAVHKNQPGIYWVDTLVMNKIQDVLSTRITQLHSLLIVHHLESLAPPPGQSAEVLQAKEKPFLTWFDGFLATSNFTRDYMLEQGFSQPILVTEPGVDIVHDQAFARQRTTESIKALMVANLVERKGVLPWLQYLTQQLERTDRFTLTIIGRTDIEPNYAQQCLQLIQKHPLLKSCVTVAGNQSPEQMPTFYQSANLFISTARMETFGMAIQEARSYRLPVLLLKGGYSAQHVLSDPAGFAFHDIAVLSNFFLNLVREPTKFTTLYQQAQQRSPQYHTWEQSAEWLIQQFDQFFDYAP